MFGSHVGTRHLTATLRGNALQKLLALLQQPVFEWGLGCVHGFMLEALDTALIDFSQTLARTQAGLNPWT